jgi:hypothetical protein
MILERRKERLGVVAYIYNPICVGGRYRKIMVQDQPRPKRISELGAGGSPL